MTISPINDVPANQFWYKFLDVDSLDYEDLADWKVSAGVGYYMTWEQCAAEVVRLDLDEELVREWFWAKVEEHRAAASGPTLDDDLPLLTWVEEPEPTLQQPTDIIPWEIVAGIKATCSGPYSPDWVVDLDLDKVHHLPHLEWLAGALKGKVGTQVVALMTDGGLPIYVGPRINGVQAASWEADQLLQLVQLAFDCRKLEVARRAAVHRGGMAER